MRSFTHARPELFLLLLLLVCAAGLGLYPSSRGVAQAAGPRVWLSQKVGPPTASVQVHGTGFGPNEPVLVAFDDTTPIESSTTDATGGFVVRATVPKTALPGTHSVRATSQSSGQTAPTPFLVRTDWIQFRFGLYHTGNNPYENVLSLANVSGLTLDWSYNAGKEIITSPAVANGVVYVGSGDGKLYALDAATGAIKWTHATESFIDHPSPVVANGMVYVGAGHIYAFHLAGMR